MTEINEVAKRIDTEVNLAIENLERIIEYRALGEDYVKRQLEYVESMLEEIKRQNKIIINNSKD